MQKILTEFHSYLVGGHGGIEITTERKFYWLRLQIDIKEFVQQCAISQQAKSENTLPVGLL